MKRIDNKIRLSLYKKSKKSGYPINVLEEVYRRGLLSEQSNHAPSKKINAFNRVNSFVAGGKAALLDEDLRKSEKHTKDLNLSSSRFDGSDELVALYKAMTPGQSGSMAKIVKRIISNRKGCTKYV